MYFLPINELIEKYGMSLFFLLGNYIGHYDPPSATSETDNDTNFPQTKTYNKEQSPGN